MTVLQEKFNPAKRRFLECFPECTKIFSLEEGQKYQGSYQPSSLEYFDSDGDLNRHRRFLLRLGYKICLFLLLSDFFLLFLFHGKYKTLKVLPIRNGNISLNLKFLQSRQTNVLPSTSPKLKGNLAFKMSQLLLLLPSCLCLLYIYMEQMFFPNSMSIALV